VVQGIKNAQNREPVTAPDLARFSDKMAAATTTFKPAEKNAAG